MRWDEAAVTSAIQSLPARTDGKGMEIGEAVMMMKLAMWSGDGNTAARARPATRKQTLAELRKLCDLCRELHQHIELRMHSPALRMVEAQISEGRDAREAKGERPLYHPLALNIELEGTFEAARAAWLQVKDGADLPQPANRGTKPGAKDVTFVAARVFEGVTGRAPARNYNAYADREGGDFLDFLGKIFDALGVKAKAAGQAKLLMEKRAVERA